MFTYQGYVLIPYDHGQGVEMWQHGEKVGFVRFSKPCGLFRGMREAMRIVREEYNAPFKCLNCYDPISEDRAHRDGKCDRCQIEDWYTFKAAEMQAELALG